MASCLGVGAMKWCDSRGESFGLMDLAPLWVGGGPCGVLVVVVCIERLGHSGGIDILGGSGSMSFYSEIGSFRMRLGLLV